MKRFILFLIIIGIIGVGIFVLPTRTEAPHEQATPTQTTKADESEFFEPSETLARNIIKNALSAQFNTETATYKVADLDHKGGPELIIGAATENTATIQVLAILNKEGAYERIGKIEYQELIREAPESKELSDIDGDGQEEIIMSLMYGGASSWAEGILDVDFAKRTTQWVQMRNKDGQIQDAIFVLAASAAYSNRFEILDIDNDGKKELSEIFAQAILDETECEVNVYEWDDTLFAFDKILSEQTRERLGSDCAM